MSRSSVAFVSSTADRCGARQATGSLAATVNFPPHDGGLYSQLKVSALLHSGKVAFQCLNRSVITHTYSELLADVNKVRKCTAVRALHLIRLADRRASNFPQSSRTIRLPFFIKGHISTSRIIHRRDCCQLRPLHPARRRVGCRPRPHCQRLQGAGHIRLLPVNFR